MIGNVKLGLLVDTGASLSILPRCYTAGLCLTPTPVKITAANGSPIMCYGETLLEIMIPSIRRSFKWTFVVADVSNPLLGADFLSNFKLLVDCAERRLVDSTTNCYIIGNKISGTIQQITINNHENIPYNIKALFEKYKGLLAPRVAYKSETGSKVVHCIETGDSLPTFAKVRQLSAAKLEAVKA